MNADDVLLGSQGKKLAIIVDLDETLCTQFDVPVEAGIGVLQRIDPFKLQVHYVTVRTAICRDATETFLRAHRLPGCDNVHYCPIPVSSLEHKRSQHELLSTNFAVVASIGDSFEEEQAATALGMRFMAVNPLKPSEAWMLLEERIAEFGGLHS
jgi:hypothetical protein